MLRQIVCTRSTHTPLLFRFFEKMKGPSCGAPRLTNFLLKVAEMERSFIDLEAHMVGLVGSDLENVLGPCLAHHS